MRGRKKCDSVNGCGTFYAQQLNECPQCGASELFSELVAFNALDWVYDLETYPNVFTASFKHMLTGERAFFEVSERCDQLPDLVAFLGALKEVGSRLIGFNNIGFDYPIIHYIMEYTTSLTVDDIYTKAASIIATPWDRRFDNVVWDSDVHIPQIDLFKIHHFDNDSRSTSLKMLEFNMRSQNVEDLPFEPGVPLTPEQVPVLCNYNHHDVDETEAFCIKSIGLMEFREKLSIKYCKNFLNHNDTKIGKDYFIMELERLLPGSCYTRIDGRRQVRQTIRHSIRVADVIFPYIQFHNPEFQRVKQWLASQVITETKGVFKDLSADIDGFKYDFGVGGIHGSIDSATVCSDDDYVIYDWDVASYYPNLAIANRLHPEHLGVEFCDIYKDVFDQRRGYAKGTPENAMLKLALNGVYGDSNSKYSPFYDPQYTMSITINGQLLLCLLAENLITIPGLTMVQINTDGLTVRCPRDQVHTMKSVCEWWESFTCLELESAIYSRMFVRDVNNYVAEYTEGGVKRKGAYEYVRDWHQNHSELVIPMAAEAELLHGIPVESFIRDHDDIFDFMLRTKVRRADKLIASDSNGNERELQKITRYYIGVEGESLVKVSPPVKGAVVGSWKRAVRLTDGFYNTVLSELQAGDWSHLHAHDLGANGLPWDERINTKNKSRYKIRRTGLNVGRLVVPCNDIRDADRSNIDFDYYIAEARKLVDPLLLETE